MRRKNFSTETLELRRHNHSVPNELARSTSYLRLARSAHASCPGSGISPRRLLVWGLVRYLMYNSSSYYQGSLQTQLQETLKRLSEFLSISDVVTWWFEKDQRTHKWDCSKTRRLLYTILSIIFFLLIPRYIWLERRKTVTSPPKPGFIFFIVREVHIT